MAEKEITIAISRHRGLAPKAFEETYPSYGNQDQAGDMRNISLLDPNVMTQGPGMAELTNGDQGGVVTTLMRGILRQAVTSNVSYAFGGAKLYQFSASTVSSGGSPSWPRTVSDDGAEVGEDIAHYQSALYYSYNQTGSIGTIGRYDLASTFDDDYWDSGTPAAADFQSPPHQMVNGGDDVLYIANGRYIASLDGTTGNDQALDFPQNTQTASVTWNNNRLIAAVNRPAISGVNQNLSSVYKWNGVDASWEGQPIEINGRLGALYTKNGVTFVWYEGFLDGVVKLIFGLLAGGRVQPLRTFSGSLPLYYQVGELFDYIVWLSSGRLFAYGPLGGEIEVDLFQLMSPQYTNTAGGIASPFGEMLIASNDGGSNYSLERESGYATDSYYKTMLFEPSLGSLKSILDRLEIQCNKLATGAGVDLDLVYNKGNTLWSDSLSFTSDGAVTKKVFFPRAHGENMRLEYDFSAGSSTNPVEIKKTLLQGKNVAFG